MQGRYGSNVDHDNEEYLRPRLLESAPASVVEYVRETADSLVLEEHPAADGFTASVASIIVTDKGRELFVKAAPTTNPSGEAVCTGAELAEVIEDIGPPLLSWAERDGWYVAVYERIAGAAVIRWQEQDIEHLTILATRMRERLDPSPVTDTKAYADAFAPLLGTWSALAAPSRGASDYVDHVRGRELPFGLSVETLAELETDWSVALHGGTSLQHGDIRRDNVMREPSGRLRLVDWTHSWTAPNWADWVRLVPDMAIDGFDPEQVFHSIIGGETHEHEVNVMLTGLAGRCWREGHLDAVPGLPQLRPMQCAQGQAILSWLAQRGVR